MLDYNLLYQEIAQKNSLNPEDVKNIANIFYENVSKAVLEFPTRYENVAEGQSICIRLGNLGKLVSDKEIMRKKFQYLKSHNKLKKRNDNKENKTNVH